MEIFAGLRSQIKNLKDRLKALDTSKKTQKEVKEVVDALNALEERYAKEKAKREEKKKLKETQNEKAPEESKEAPKETVEASESVSVEKEAVPDIMPETGTNWPELLKNKEYKPMDPEKKKEVVKNVEKKLGPAIIGFKQDDVVKPARGSESLGRVIRCDASEENPAGLVYVFWDSGPLKDRDVAGGYYMADLVKHSAEEPKPEHPCPCWEDLSKYCPKCKSRKTSDLKSNYEEMLEDLKDEYKEALDKHDHIWVAKLKKKIEDLEAKIQEKFGNEKHASGKVILKQNGETKGTFNSQNEALMWLHKQVDYSWDYAMKHMGWTIEEQNEKQAKEWIHKPKWTHKGPFHKEWEGSINKDHDMCEHCGECATCNLPDRECNAAMIDHPSGTERLVTIDQTPPGDKANYNPDGGTSSSEYQDELAMPSGSDRNLNSAKGVPGSLFNVQTAPKVVEDLKSFLNAPYINAYPSTLGGDEHISIMLTISADPKETWPNGILQNSRYGNFRISNDGELEQFSGAFAPKPQPTRFLRKRNVKDVQQLIDVLNAFLAQVNATPKAASLEANAANTCAICKEEFKSWPEYNEHRLTKHKPNLVKQPETKTSALKVNVFNRDWNVTPIVKDSSLSYEVSDSSGKKLMNLKPANGKEWSEAEIKAALKNELQKGFKQAKLLSKIAFLPSGSKVTILSTSKDGKQSRFASIEHGVRGWTATSNIKLLALDGQSLAHEGHQDKVLAIHETESLIECPTRGVHWENIPAKLPTHDKSTTPPPATPESLHVEEGQDPSKVSPQPGKGYNDGMDQVVPLGSPLDDTHGKGVPSLKSSKKCPDCKGEFVGEEGEKCPTCGRFAVQKESLKTALPPTIPNERAYLDNPPVDKQADEEEYDKPDEEDIFIQSEGKLGSKTVAYQGRKPIAELHDDWEKFYKEIKNWMEANSWFPTVWQVSDHGNVHLDTDFLEWMNKNQLKTSSLNKIARVVHRTDGWHVLSEKGKNLGGPYATKDEAVKRLRQVEYFKHHGSLKPFSKKEAAGEKCATCGHAKYNHALGAKEAEKYGKVLECLNKYCDCKKYKKSKTAEVLTDPYQALQTQVQTLRDRMSLVQERLQSNPLPKEAGEGEKDNSELDIPALLEDLSMGIDLLETKLQGDKVEEDVHPAIEEMENLLWSVEEKLGITPKLSEEEKAEPEHKEIVKDLEKEAGSSITHKSAGEGSMGKVTSCKKFINNNTKVSNKWADVTCKECLKNHKEATTTPTSPLSPSSPASTGTATPTPAAEADKPTCALCGGLEFTDFAKYQNHMEYTHASDTMPTSPSQKSLPTTIGSKKKAADVTLTDESIEDKLTTDQQVTDSTTQLMPVPSVPTPQNVQPTDDDNLEIPTQMPSSPPSPGQKWVWDSSNGKFVSMPNNLKSLI